VSTPVCRVLQTIGHPSLTVDNLRESNNRVQRCNYRHDRILRGGEGRLPVANVTVFVDDAVLGNLPSVCVIDGVVTDDALTFAHQVGIRTGLGVAWLLILAGPLGWLGLVLIASFRQSGELLTVTLPFSQAAYLRKVRAERSRMRAVLIMVVMLVAAFGTWVQRITDYSFFAPGLAVIGCAALVSVIVEAAKVQRMTVRLDLDASRRWLTLSGVHPSFMSAVLRGDSESRSHSMY
jgi:hypothetical protein